MIKASYKLPVVLSLRQAPQFSVGSSAQCIPRLQLGLVIHSVKLWIFLPPMTAGSGMARRTSALRMFLYYSCIDYITFVL